MSGDVQKKQVNFASSFQDLIVWQRAAELSVAIYKLTAEYPASEQFGLTNQLRRAGVSVASNIAEGYGRASKGEYIQFLGHARDSNCEIQTQLFISERFGFGLESERARSRALANEVGRMLVSMMRN